MSQDAFIAAKKKEDEEKEKTEVEQYVARCLARLAADRAYHKSCVGVW